MLHRGKKFTVLNQVVRCNVKLRERNTTLKRIKEDIYKTSGLTQNAKELKNSGKGKNSTSQITSDLHYIC